MALFTLYGEDVGGKIDWKIKQNNLKTMFEVLGPIEIDLAQNKIQILNGISPFDPKTVQSKHFFMFLFGRPS